MGPLEVLIGVILVTALFSFAMGIRSKNKGVKFPETTKPSRRRRLAGVLILLAYTSVAASVGILGLSLYMLITFPSNFGLWGLPMSTAALILSLSYYLLQLADAVERDMEPLTGG